MHIFIYKREGLSNGKREEMHNKGSDCTREFMGECNSEMQRKVRREELRNGKREVMQKKGSDCMRKNMRVLDREWKRKGVCNRQRN